MSVIGIDLGFQTSTVAAPNSGGIEVLLNEYSQRATKSWISFTEKNRELGDAGHQKAVTNFKNTIGNFKHLIGRNFADEDVQAELARCPYKSEAMEDGGIGFRVNYLGEDRVFSVTQIVGMLLTKMKSVAEKETKGKVSDCCIGVPSSFNDRQRHAMLAASKIAGLNCLRLFNETAAVALAYGIYKQDLPKEDEKPRRVVFVDLGHSQCQMSACSLVKGKLTVEAVATEMVGGQDLDLLLFEHFAEVFKASKKIDIKSNARATIRLMNEVQKLKKLMSANSTPCPLNIECIMDDTDVAGKMARAEFEEMAAPVFAKVKECAQRLLGQLSAGSDKVTNKDIDFIEIVGGSVRIPAVKALLSEVFEKELSTTLNLDEAVARGCALEGAIKSPTFRVRDFVISDRTMYSINLSWQNQLDKDTEGEAEDNAEVFQANSKMSVSKMLSFYRDTDFDLNAKYSDPSLTPGKMEAIGNFRVEGVTPGYDGSSQKVKFKLLLDDHGCFSIGDAHMIEKMPPVEEPAEEPAKEETKNEDGKKEDEKKEDEKKEEDKKEEDKKEGDKKDDKKKEEPVKKKAKTTKTKVLKVVATKPSVLSSDDVHKLLEAELAMQAQDRSEREKSDAKNELEEYIYAIRDTMYNESYHPFIKEEDREKFSAQVSQYEDWLYDEGEDVAKSVYNEKLSDLKKVGEACKTRHSEAQSRGPAVANYQSAIVACRKFLEQKAAGDEKYAHIEEADVKKAAEALESKEKWLNESIAKQAGLKQYEDPAISTSQILSMQAAFDAVYQPIMNKPVPKVEPPPPAKEESKQEAKEEAKEGEAKEEEKKEGEEAKPEAEGGDSKTMEID